MTGLLERVCAPFVALVLSALPAHAEAPNVVASIAPVHSLVASVMEGAGEPELLIAADISVHDYALRPSDIRKIANADLVVWVGEALETYLARPLATEGTANLELLDAEGIDPHAYGQVEDGDEHHDDGDADEDESADPHGHGHLGLDPHIWLDPLRAVTIVNAVAERLAEIDPDNAALYEQNRIGTVARLEALNADIEARLAPFRDVPFVTFHDGYSYFVERYGLSQVGELTVHPEMRPGAASLRELHATIETAGVTCAFSEPQFDAGSIRSLAGDSVMNVGVLDALGADLDPGPALYEELLLRNVEAILSCLAS